MRDTANPIPAAFSIYGVPRPVGNPARQTSTKPLLAIKLPFFPERVQTPSL